MKQFLRLAAFTLSLLFVSGFTECYKPVNKTQLPAHIKTVAVPAFQLGPEGLRFKVEQRVSTEFLEEEGDIEPDVVVSPEEDEAADEDDS